MQTKNNLVVMLTHNDQTVLEAAKIFEQCRHSKAQFWGFKEVPLPLENMKHLYAYMKECGKTTFLEVVEYTEDAGLVGAEIAFECGCDILMGTRFFDSINQFCKEHQIKYMPFVGGLQGRPTVLAGQIEELLLRRRSMRQKGFMVLIYWDTVM